MKDLKMKRCKVDAISVKDGRCIRGKRSVVLNVRYEDLNRSCGIYLTPCMARRLRDWLDGWLKEHEGKKGKR